jgi:hypothetical protein
MMIVRHNKNDWNTQLPKWQYFVCEKKQNVASYNFEASIFIQLLMLMHNSMCDRIVEFVGSDSFENSMNGQW